MQIRVAHESNVLRQFVKTPGYVVSLVKVITASEQEADIGVKQAASIRLKDLFKRNWARFTGDEEQYIIPAGEKQLVKENILEVMVHCPPLVRYSFIAVLLVTFLRFLTPPFFFFSPLYFSQVSSLSRRQLHCGLGLS